MPERVALQIRTCTVEHMDHLGRAHPFVSFEIKFANDGQVDTVEVRESTLGDEPLEACMASAIRRLSEDDLPMRQSHSDHRGPVAPEWRALLGQEEALAACLASPPCLLTMTFLMGAAYITVQLYVYASSHASTTKHKPRTAPTATAVPTATTAPTTTAIPVARRYPNQTCDDEELDRLEDEKDKLCKREYAAACGGKVSDKTKARTPCSAILLSIQQRLACLNARMLVQDKCFGGKPDAGHKSQIDQTQQGIDNCEALKLINCAKGHPMAGL